MKVDVDYLEHEGGTKFYETVLLHDDDFSGRALLIKRFGPMNQSIVGGQAQIHEGGLADMKTERQRILAEKTRSAKGYDRAPSGRAAMHKLDQSDVSPGLVLSHARGTYGTKSAAISRIESFIASYGDPEVVEEGAPPAEPEPEIDRGATWGSF